MSLPTSVTILNGYMGSKPFQADAGVILDANDIHISGSTGETVKSKCEEISGDVQTLRLQLIQADDYAVQIGSYQM